MLNSIYGIKSVSNTDVHYIVYSSPMTAPFFTRQKLQTILEFKRFQGPLMLNSKTFKHQICLQGLSRALKNENKFSRTCKEEWPP